MISTSCGCFSFCLLIIYYVDTCLFYLISMLSLHWHSCWCLPITSVKPMFPMSYLHRFQSWKEKVHLRMWWFIHCLTTHHACINCFDRAVEIYFGRSYPLSSFAITTRQCIVLWSKSSANWHGWHGPIYRYSILGSQTPHSSTNVLYFL